MRRGGRHDGGAARQRKRRGDDNHGEVLGGFLAAKKFRGRTSSCRLDGTRVEVYMMV